MKIGGFKLCEPVQECYEPYVFACLRPWIDVNNVGSLVLGELETQFNAKELGKLSKPGDFFDFTRYRPIIHIEGGIRGLSVPNSRIFHAKREGKNDIFMLHLLEPHAHAEAYVDSVVKFLKTFKIKKYILLGSMHDAVPHTKPMLVSGYAMGQGIENDIKRLGILPIEYQGPSSIVNLIAKKAAESGIDVAVFMVSLPQYVVLEEDYQGKVKLMEILNTLYDIPVDRVDFDKAFEQRDIISKKVENSPEARMFLPQLESAYDLRLKAMESELKEQLTPEMEDILWRITGNDIGKA
ncbi:MAG TPA: PAC2 family protein [Syntrophorhabdaceae bacterium]|nr:PAC2 family protein [Syntrophorhabdaceae bacterium]HOS06335.1 PAC2 family protein [Syntrophorhabdaceae bacterium]HPL40363.1 PAC2 family protein [Syntrophorhabdaceae bacterium]